MSNEAKKFQRCKEDFICKHCKTKNIGDGYTNHCINCLWSRHVDINPGDRASCCGGMMKPIAVDVSAGNKYAVLHQCEKCGFERKNKINEKDNFEAILSIASKKH